MNRMIRISTEVMAGLWPIIVPLGILRAVGSLGLRRVLFGPALAATRILLGIPEEPAGTEV